MNKLTSIRIKQEDGTYSEEYPVSVLAENVIWEQGQSNSLVDILGQVSFSTNGSIQHQIDVLDNKKFNTSDLNTYLAGQISTDVTSWLNTNVNPVGSAVTVDESLSISGSAADAKKTGDEIADVKSALEDIIDTRNLFWDAKFVSGKYYYGREYNVETQGYFVVPVVSGNTYTFGCNVRFLSSVSAGIDNTEHAAGYQYTPDFTGDLYVTVRLAQADQYAMCLSTVDVSEVGTTEAPRLAQHLLAQESGDSASLAMSQVGVKTAIASTAVLLDGEGQVTPENIEGVTVTGGNVLDDAERLYCTQPRHVGSGGYVGVINTGAIVSNEVDYCTFLIKVKPNSTYTASHHIRFLVLLRNANTSRTSPVVYTGVIGSALANVASFETGEAEYALVSWNYNSFPVEDFVISKGNTATEERTVNLPDWWTGGGSDPVKPKFVSTTGNLSDGTFLALMGYKQNLRKGERYVFSGNIASISAIKFGFTSANTFSASADMRNEFTIDDEHITYKTIGSNANYTYQYTHGLTLTNNLQFIFEYLPEGNAKITLISNGMMFTQMLPFIKQTISQVVVLSTGSTLTDCKLTWTPIDIDKAIWMFGDSYFAYDAARWTYYLQQYGYAENALIDGFPGEGSVNARNSLLTLIQFGTPKYIVWCMGMNDGSDTDASNPNSSWTVRRDEMLTICNANGITPIFATIPNVPSILNTGKNAWIKASGYKYIDFAAAVGAESAGSTWFTGMLSSDNVHPSESGAKALFARALVDFPEIMLND